MNATSIKSEYGYYPDIAFLEQKFKNIQDKQGVLGSIWNDVKELTTLGVSESDCISMLEKYKNGEMSFEQIAEFLEEYDVKQENASGLLSNILTGIGGIIMATAAATSGPIGWGLAFLKGAPIGAALKTGINFIDRATNDVEGDALDAKQMTKDAVSGALTGAASAVSGASSFGYKVMSSKGLVEAGTIAADVVKGACCGMECGAMSGAGTYMTDVALGDKDFEFDDLLANTATSALVSGTVGSVVGVGLNGLNKTGFADFGTVTRDSISSSTRKVLGAETKDMLGIS